MWALSSPQGPVQQPRLKGQQTMTFRSDMERSWRGGARMAVMSTSLPQEGQPVALSRWSSMHVRQKISSQSWQALAASVHHGSMHRWQRSSAGTSDLFAKMTRVGLDMVVEGAK